MLELAFIKDEKGIFARTFSVHEEYGLSFGNEKVYFHKKNTQFFEGWVKCNVLQKLYQKEDWITYSVQLIINEEESEFILNASLPSYLEHQVSKEKKYHLQLKISKEKIFSNKPNFIITYGSFKEECFFAEIDFANLWTGRVTVGDLGIDIQNEMLRQTKEYHKKKQIELESELDKVAKELDKAKKNYIEAKEALKKFMSNNNLPS